jgi:hypothetical protein
MAKEQDETAAKQREIMAKVIRDRLNDHDPDDDRD